MEFVRLFSLLAFLIYTHLSAQECREFLEKGDQYYATFEFEKALRQYQECQRNDDQNVESNYKAGLALSQLQRNSDARLNLIKAHELDSTHTMAIYHLAKIESILGNKQSQLDLLRKLKRLSPNTMYFRLEYAQSLSKYGFLDEAITEYLDLLNLSKDDTNILEKLAGLYLDYDELNIADSLVNIAYQNSHIRPISLLQTKARISYKLKHDEDVVNTIDEMNERGDSTIQFMKLKASCLYNLMQYEKSAQICERLAEKLVPKLDEYVHYLAASSYEKIGELDTSLFHYNMAINAGTSGNLGLYYERTGHILEEQGNIADAIQSYQDQLFYIKKPETYYKLGILSDQYFADKTIARNYYQTFIRKAASTEMKSFVQYSKNRLISIQEELHQQQK